MQITFGHKKNQRIWGLQLYVNEFRFSKMEISFLSMQQPAKGSYTRAKRRHADAIKWYLIKNLFS
jgi:hypothetical protein